MNLPIISMAINYEQLYMTNEKNKFCFQYQFNKNGYDNKILLAEIKI